MKDDEVLVLAHNIDWKVIIIVSILEKAAFRLFNNI